MDLRQNKPIHLRCPKCGHDFSFNGNKIIQEKQSVAKEIQTLMAKMSDMVSQNGSLVKKSPEYKRLKARLEDAQLRSQALKNLNRNLSEFSELERYKIFHKKVKSVLGDEKTIQLIKESEDELVYRDYDMAIQKFTNFDGV